MGFTFIGYGLYVGLLLNVRFFGGTVNIRSASPSYESTIELGRCRAFAPQVLKGLCRLFIACVMTIPLFALLLWVSSR